MLNAESVFAMYIAQVEAGGKGDFEALCAEHPTLDEELREFKASYDKVGPILRANLPDAGPGRIRDLHRSEPHPKAEFEADNPARGDNFSSEVLTRLSAHAGGYGRYRIRGEIARGGQGVVLRVWDEDLRRNLAMKVILGNGSTPTRDTPDLDPKTLGRFLEEAQVTGQLDHPGIVPVHELGLDSEGQVYFTMKLVKGETFKEVIDKVHRGEDGWTMTRALGVLLRVCEAMAYAHSKGVIHRDLKPANIMVGRFGEVYVMDWGLARVQGREDAKDIRIMDPLGSKSTVRSERRDRAGETVNSPLVTMDGDVVGTPAYMSPEQARGELSKVGPATDVYAIGAMLYHLLSGQLPYVASGVRINNYTVWQRVQEGPPTALQYLTKAPIELEAICNKAMMRQPEQRFTGTLGVGQDLQAYLDGKVVAALEVGPLAEARKWIARNRALAASFAGLLLISVVGGTHTIYANGKLRNEILNNSELTSKLHAKANDLEKKSYLLGVRAAVEALGRGDRKAALEFLEECPMEARGWDWEVIKRRLDTSTGTVSLGRFLSAVDATGDLGLVAAGDHSGNVVIYDRSKNQVTCILEHDFRSRVSHVAVQDEGTLVAAAAGPGVCAWSLPGGNPWPMQAAAQGTTRVLEWIDNERLVRATAERIQIITKRGIESEVSGFDIPSGATFDREGESILYVDGNGNIIAQDILGGASRQMLEHGLEGLRGCVATPFGVFGETGDAMLRVSPEGAGRSWPTGLSESVSWMVSRTGGDHIAYGGGDVLGLWNVRTDTRQVLMGHEGEIAGAVLAKDGTEVVSAGRDQVLKFWSLSSGGPTRPRLDIGIQAVDAWVSEEEELCIVLGYSSSEKNYRVVGIDLEDGSCVYNTRVKDALWVLEGGVIAMLEDDRLRIETPKRRSNGLVLRVPHDMQSVDAVQAFGPFIVYCGIRKAWSKQRGVIQVFRRDTGKVVRIRSEDPFLLAPIPSTGLFAVVCGSLRSKPVAAQVLDPADGSQRGTLDLTMSPASRTRIIRTRDFSPAEGYCYDLLENGAVDPRVVKGFLSSAAVSIPGSMRPPSEYSSRRFRVDWETRTLLDPEASSLVDRTTFEFMTKRRGRSDFTAATLKGSRMAVALENGLIEVWDASSNERIAELARLEEEVALMLISDSGRNVLAFTESGFMYEL